MNVVAMVQALRGRMWKSFLGLENVKKPGRYDKLVAEALGSRHPKRKVQGPADWGGEVQL